MCSGAFRKVCPVFCCRNCDGFVDREEFGDILHMTGEPVTEEDIDEMFGESDTNKDGKIDFDGRTQARVGAAQWRLPGVSLSPSVFY